LRKDRVAELKAEKARLESLAREKAHSDKLRARITELNSIIASKEILYDETKKDYDAQAESNVKLYEYSTKFREMFTKVEGLEKQIRGHQEDLDQAKLNIQVIEGE
jgi:DNA repair protein RAD50